MSSPSSFCTVSTNSCKHELKLLLTSLAKCHPKSKVYIVCDMPTYESIATMNNGLQLYLYVELDKYTNLSRQQMTQQGIWGEFQMAKATAIEHALAYNTDTLFIDSDVIFLEPVNHIDPTKQLGLSKGYINEDTASKVGIYNGGFLWTNQRTLPMKWRQYTKTSRYFDQASIEDLAREYIFFEFPEQYNFQSWRFIVGDTPNPEKDFKPIRGHILYKGKRLQSIHTHFGDPRFEQINQFFLAQLKQANIALKVYNN
jgi:hypothetical protein